MRYFRRPNPQQRLSYSDGKRVDVEMIGNNWGLIAIDEKKEGQHTQELDALADQHRGIERITAEIYEELKKKCPYVPPKVNPLKELRLFDEQAALAKLNAPTAAAQASSAHPVVVVPVQPVAELGPGNPPPVDGPKPFKPRVGKARKAPPAE